VDTLQVLRREGNRSRNRNRRQVEIQSKPVVQSFSAMTKIKPAGPGRVEWRRKPDLKGSGFLSRLTRIRPLRRCALAALAYNLALLTARESGGPYKSPSPKDLFAFVQRTTVQRYGIPSFSIPYSISTFCHCHQSSFPTPATPTPIPSPIHARNSPFPAIELLLCCSAALLIWPPPTP
jgi:hypothetical protein